VLGIALFKENVSVHCRMHRIEATVPGIGRAGVATKPNIVGAAASPERTDTPSRKDLLAQ
jgi:hypothetical protein